MGTNTVNRLQTALFLNDFKKMINESRNNRDIHEAISKLHERGIKNEITVPKLFEFIVHKNIVLKHKKGMKDKLIISVDVELDWNGFRNDLKEYILNIVSFGFRIDNKKKFLDDMKQKLVRGEVINYNGDFNQEDLIKVELFFLLFKEAWKIICAFFPLCEYGYPSQYLIVSLFNLILGDEHKVGEEKPLLVPTYEKYLLKLYFENVFLKNKLKEANIELDDFVEYQKELLLVDEIYDKNPVYSIIVNPDISKSKLSNSFIEVDTSLLLIQEEIDVKKATIEQMWQYNVLYADKYYNKKMSAEKIAHELSNELLLIDDSEENKENLSKYEKLLLKKGVKGFEVKPVEIDIKAMCKYSGFEK